MAVKTGGIRMTMLSPTQPANGNKRLLFACYHFYLDPSNGAAIQQALAALPIPREHGRILPLLFGKTPFLSDIERCGTQTVNRKSY
jgi:hypothetical protein